MHKKDIYSLSLRRVRLLLSVLSALLALCDGWWRYCNLLIYRNLC